MLRNYSGSRFTSSCYGSRSAYRQRARSCSCLSRSGPGSRGGRAGSHDSAVRSLPSGRLAALQSHRAASARADTKSRSALGRSGRSDPALGSERVPRGLVDLRDRWEVPEGSQRQREESCSIVI